MHSNTFPSWEWVAVHGCAPEITLMFFTPRRSTNRDARLGVHRWLAIPLTLEGFPSPGVRPAHPDGQ